MLDKGPMEITWDASRGLLATGTEDGDVPMTNKHIVLAANGDFACKTGAFK